MVYESYQLEGKVNANTRNLQELRKKHVPVYQASGGTTLWWNGEVELIFGGLRLHQELNATTNVIQCFNEVSSIAPHFQRAATRNFFLPINLFRHDIVLVSWQFCILSKLQCFSTQSSCDIFLVARVEMANNLLVDLPPFWSLCHEHAEVERHSNARQALNLRDPHKKPQETC